MRPDNFPMAWCCDLTDVESQSFDPVAAQLCSRAASAEITLDELDEALDDVAMTRVAARFAVVVN